MPCPNRVAVTQTIRIAHIRVVGTKSLALGSRITLNTKACAGTPSRLENTPSSSVLQLTNPY